MSGNIAAPTTKRITKAMENGAATKVVHLNLYERAMLVSTLNTATVSVNEARKRQKLYRRLRPDAEEMSRYGITEPRPGQFQWPSVVTTDIMTSEERPFEMSASQHELVCDVYGLLIETQQIKITLDVLSLMEKFLGEEEIDRIADEMEDSDA